jgi:hypothetical protein
VDERHVGSDDIEQLIDSLTRDLMEEFRDQVPPETVERMVSESVHAYSASRIQTYVSILVRREARSRLRRLATAEAS